MKIEHRNPPMQSSHVCQLLSIQIHTHEILRKSIFMNMFDTRKIRRKMPGLMHMIDEQVQALRLLWKNKRQVAFFPYIISWTLITRFT